MKKIMLLVLMVSVSLNMLAQTAEDTLVKNGDEVPAFTLNSSKYGLSTPKT